MENKFGFGLVWRIGKWGNSPVRKRGKLFKVCVLNRVDRDGIDD